jgi:penicillin-binding protein 1A
MEPSDRRYPRTGSWTPAQRQNRIAREAHRALFAKRQPGSAFKPFVYEAALQAGLSPASMVDDDPVEVAVGRTVWRPANYSDNYAGQVTLRRALTLSANAATVRVSRTVGEPAVLRLAPQRHHGPDTCRSRHRVRCKST